MRKRFLIIIKIIMFLKKISTFDKEYFEWIDLLEAVYDANNKVFTMLELGTEYGTWPLNDARACNL
ncbi:hypothetical protein DSN97_04245 [Deferribacteraceae bacterium V6Fe1]|nr:hypothetical protein DSN97_04245 [Deferribacteraceae bacterium V6Fe1]